MDLNKQISLKQKIHHFFLIKSMDHVIDVLNYTPGNYFLKSVDGQYLACNISMLKALELQKQDFVGKNDQMLWPSYAAEIKKYEDDIIASRQPTSIELYVLTSDGQQKIFVMTISLWRKVGKQIFIGSLNDITHQRNTENELKRKYDFTNLHLEEIVEGSPGNLYWKNINGVYLGCNQNMIKVSKLNSKADIIGKSDKELWPNFANSIKENDLLVLQTGKTIQTEEKVGDQVYLSAKMPLRDEKNNIIGIIGNSIDITTLKQTELNLRKTKEELEIANKAKTEFIHNMEHDIRTPFNGIVGLASILLNQETDSSKREIITDILKCTTELLDYNNGVLDFSRIEGGYLPVLAKKFDLKKLLEGIIHMEMPAAKLKFLDFSLNFPQNAPTMIVGDRYRLQRVLINLISNSIKFTKEGYVKLSVKLSEKSDQRNVILQFIVEDSGIGIPQEVQDTIFEKFSRITPSNRGHYKGQGLGLPIVKRFIEDMEGDIEVESTIGEGTKFICILPFKLPLINVIVDNT